MFKLVVKFKRNAENFLKENIAKSSKKSRKQGKNKFKLFIFFKVVESKIFFKTKVMNIKITVKLKFYSLSKNWNKETLKAIMNNVIVYELLFSIQTY